MGAGGSKKVKPGLADTDKDGIISVEELDAMLQETGIDWPRKRKEKLLSLASNSLGPIDTRLLLTAPSPSLGLSLIHI